MNKVFNIITYDYTQARVDSIYSMLEYDMASYDRIWELAAGVEAKLVGAACAGVWHPYKLILFAKEQHRLQRQFRYYVASANNLRNNIKAREKELPIKVLMELRIRGKLNGLLSKYDYENVSKKDITNIVKKVLNYY